MDQPRIKLGKAVPELYQTLGSLDEVVTVAGEAADMSVGFMHLLRLRASQINQCPYCVRLHTRDAMASGETSDRISLVSAWRDTEYFDDKERAALALVEAITLIADGQVPDAVYAEAAAVLTEQEIAAVESLAVVINAWNRFSIASRVRVKP